MTRRPFAATLRAAPIAPSCEARGRRRLPAELAETNQGVVALYAELDDNAAPAARGLRPEEPVPVLHEPRVPDAARLDPQHRPAPARPARRAADRRAGDAGRVHPDVGRRADRDGQRPARPGQGRSRPGHHLAGVVRDGRPVLRAARHVQADPASSRRCRWSSRSRAACRRIYTDDKKLSQILRNFISNALKFTADGEVRVIGHAGRRRPRDLLRSPTPASASPPSTSARCSRTSCRWTRRSRSGCAAPASACR